MTSAKRTSSSVLGSAFVWLFLAVTVWRQLPQAWDAAGRMSWVSAAVGLVSILWLACLAVFLGVTPLLGRRFSDFVPEAANQHPASRSSGRWARMEDWFWTAVSGVALSMMFLALDRMLHGSGMPIWGMALLMVAFGLGLWFLALRLHRVHGVQLIRL
jgi:hypothetical protein